MPQETTLLLLVIYLYSVLADGLFNGTEILNSLEKSHTIKKFHSDSIEPRIVGGHPASEGQFPYQVAVFPTGFLCGGSILNDTFIITAAHCVNGLTGKDVTVGIGGINYRTITRYAVKYVYQHEDYYVLSNNAPVNDIALLELQYPISTMNLNYPTSIVTLTNTVPQINTMCTVTGWGALKENGSASDILQYIQLPIVSCANYGSFITPGMICAGFQDGSGDSCQGDSGGPLMCNGELAGIVSFGYGCARPFYTAVYTNVNYYRSWITDKYHYPNSKDSYLYATSTILITCMLATLKHFR